MKAGVAVQVELANLTLHVVSVTPAVFKIRNFLSDFEADYMIEQVRHGGSCTAAAAGWM